MYWGSVKFFKHLIILAIISAVVIPSCFAANQYMANKSLTRELDIVAKDYGELYHQYKELEKTAEFATTQEANNQNLNRGNQNFDLTYQNIFPDLYIDEIPPQTRESNTIYLSFDDGPSDLTAKVLDVLAEKEVKATFFVVGSNLETDRGVALLRRIVREGHSVGIHCYSHVYANLYSSVETYLEDFDKVFWKIYDITGEKAEIFRFPGGSINGYNRGMYRELIAELLRRGFVYYDWNVSSKDSDSVTNKNQIFEDVVSVAKVKPRSIVLMHDTNSKKETLKALPEIIDHLKANNFEFRVITREVAPIIFVYRD